MHFRVHFLRGLIATIASVGLVACHHHCLASVGRDGLTTFSRLDTSDHPELSLPTGLWRSVFFEESETTETPEIRETGEKTAAEPSSRLRSGVRSAKHELAAVRLDHEFLISSGLGDEPISDQPIEEPSSSSALSDWERAVCLAAGTGEKGFTRQGPSVISLIVGVVGLAIVVGAYIRSAR